MAEARKHAVEHASDNSPLRWTVLSRRPRDPPLRAAIVETAIDLSVDNRELPLAGPPPTSEPPDSKSSAGEPPDGQPHGGLLLAASLRPGVAALVVGGT